jgi:adenylate cyclase class IV
MASEREIKLPVKDVEALKAALARLSARPVGPGSGRLHEWNTIFDTAGQDLAKKGHLLRVRRETPEIEGSKSRFLVTFKKPSEHARADERGHKVREEIETEVSDGEAVKRIVEGLGFAGWCS